MTNHVWNSLGNVVPGLVTKIDRCINCVTIRCSIADRRYINQGVIAKEPFGITRVAANDASRDVFYAILDDLMENDKNLGYVFSYQMPSRMKIIDGIVWARWDTYHPKCTDY